MSQPARGNIQLLRVNETCDLFTHADAAVNQKYDFLFTRCRLSPRPPDKSTFIFSFQSFTSISEHVGGGKLGIWRSLCWKKPKKQEMFLMVQKKSATFLIGGTTDGSDHLWICKDQQIFHGLKMIIYIFFFYPVSFCRFGLSTFRTSLRTINNTREKFSIFFKKFGFSDLSSSEPSSQTNR